MERVWIGIKKLHEFRVIYGIGFVGICESLDEVSEHRNVIIGN